MAARYDVLTTSTLKNSSDEDGGIARYSCSESFKKIFNRSVV